MLHSALGDKFLALCVLVGGTVRQLSLDRSPRLLPLRGVNLPSRDPLFNLRDTLVVIAGARVRGSDELGIAQVVDTFRLTIRTHSQRKE